MLFIIIVVLVILALGGFGHSGYQRGWYGRDPYYERPPNAGYGGSGLGLVIVLVILFLIFSHHRY